MCFVDLHCCHHCAINYKIEIHHSYQMLSSFIAPSHALHALITHPPTLSYGPPSFHLTFFHHRYTLPHQVSSYLHPYLTSPFYHGNITAHPPRTSTQHISGSYITPKYAFPQGTHIHSFLLHPTHPTTHTTPNTLGSYTTSSFSSRYS